LNDLPGTPDSKNECTSLRTPKRLTLKDIYESPLAQKTKDLAEKQLEIKRLNEYLEAEQREKFELQDQLQKQQEKTKLLTKQLNEKHEEMKKLKDEWLATDYDSHWKCEGRRSPDLTLKKDMKTLEMYTSTIEAELGSLREDNSSLHQKLMLAEEQCNFWNTKYEEYHSVCNKLQDEMVKKEAELSAMKELCSQLQMIQQSGKQTVSEDGDTSWSCQPTSPVFSPENMRVVVDIKLAEVEEENKRLKDELKTVLLEEEEMKKCVSNLECRLDTANQCIHSLKTCKLELEKKVSSKTHYFWK
ncbi:hypothetical protein L9F63_012641, partial [Diploptera punctata]